MCVCVVRLEQIQFQHIFAPDETFLQVIITCILFARKSQPNG